jgi:hypothetical protein
VRASLHALATEGITRCHAFLLARHMTALRFWEQAEGELRHDLRVVTLMANVPD